MNVWNRIYNGLFIFICVICIEYIMGTLVYLFGLIEEQPGILYSIYGAIVGGLIFIYFYKDKIKGFKLTYLIIVIILAIGVYYFTLNY